MAGPARSNRTRRKKSRLWKRDPLDWYVEPASVTRQLLAVETFPGITWDPACGQGNIASTFQGASLVCIGTDIRQRIEGASWFAGTHDFLANPPPSFRFDHIVTNPPFFRGKGTEGFIRRALELASGKVAVFTETRFLSGSRRAATLYAEHPPTAIWIVTPRPSCPPGEYLRDGGEAKGGTSDWCWIVWDQEQKADQTRIGWLTHAHLELPVRAAGLAAAA